jgi:PHP family Zn ribbon phosphoesterase
MLREFKGDLHVHTCLSPCAGLEMLPTRIIRRAKEMNLDMIGICDHNSSENVQAVIEAGSREGVAVIGGIEMTSREEVHLLALFEADADLERVQSVVYEHLPGLNEVDVFGEQLVVDAEDGITCTSERLLIGATTLSLEDIVRLIHDAGGLAVASHVDREAFSVIGQLGFIPEDLNVDAVEISSRTSMEEARDRFPQVKRFPVIRSSDAHFLEDIGRVYTSFFIEKTTIEEIGKAFLGREGRTLEAH